MTTSAGIKPGRHTGGLGECCHYCANSVPRFSQVPGFSIAALKQLYNVDIFSTFYTQGYKSDHGNINNPSKDRAVRPTYKMF